MKAYAFLHGLYELQRNGSLKAFVSTEDENTGAVRLSFHLKEEFGLLLLGTQKRLGLSGKAGHEVIVLLSKNHHPTSFALKRRGVKSEEVHSFSHIDELKDYRLGEPIHFGGQ